MTTNLDEIYRLLIDANPWWGDGKVPEALSHVYHRLISYWWSGSKCDAT